MKNRSMKVIAGIRRASRDSDHKRCPQPVQEVWLRSAGWKGNGQEPELLMAKTCGRKKTGTDYRWNNKAGALRPGMI
jgi:hypothetical protein